MLNELYDLSLSLERAGITPTDWHPDLKELPRVSKAKPCFKIYLDSDGSVTNIEPVGKAAETAIRFHVSTFDHCSRLVKNIRQAQMRKNALMIGLKA